MPDTPVGKLTRISPVSSGQTVEKPTGKLQIIGKSSTMEDLSDGYRTANVFDEKEKAVNEKVDALDLSSGYNEDEKQYLKDLSKNNPQMSYDEWNTHLQTMGGNNPIQGGDQRYYLDDKGLPVPLAYSQKPPKGKEVESIWGSQKSANDDNPFTTIGKNLISVIPDLIQSVGSVGNMVNLAVNDKDADWYVNMSNRLDALHPKTSEASKESFIDTSKVKTASDIFNPSNYHFTVDNVAGNVSQLANTVLQFIAGGEMAKGLQIGAKSIQAVQVAREADAVAGVGTVAYDALSTGTKVAAKAPYYVGSVMTNIGEVLEACDENGIKGRNKLAVSLAAALPMSLLDMELGLTGKIMNSPVANKEKTAMIKNLVKGLEKDAEGNVTKEAIGEFYKTTTIHATSLFSKMAKDAAITGAEEAGQEVAQQFIQNGAKQIYDSVNGEDKVKGEGKFGVTIASPESLADYVNNAIGGFMGGAIGGAGIHKARAEAQSESAYESVKKGPTAIQGLKTELSSAVKNGRITPEEFEVAKMKIDHYQDFYEKTKDANLKDTDRKRTFDLMYHNGNIDTQIEALAEKKNGGPGDRFIDDQIATKEALKANNDKEIREILKIADIQQQTVVSDADAKPTQKTAPVVKAKAPEAKKPEVKKEVIPETKEAEVKTEKKPMVIKAVKSKEAEVEKPVIEEKKEETVQDKPVEAIKVKKTPVEKKTKNKDVKIELTDEVKDEPVFEGKGEDLITELSKKKSKKPVIGKVLLRDGKTVPNLPSVEVGGKLYEMASKNRVVSALKEHNMDIKDLHDVEVSIRHDKAESWNPGGKIKNEKTGEAYGDRVMVVAKNKEGKEFDLGSVKVTDYKAYAEKVSSERKAESEKTPLKFVAGKSTDITKLSDEDIKKHPDFVEFKKKNGKLSEEKVIEYYKKCKG